MQPAGLVPKRKGDGIGAKLAWDGGSAHAHTDANHVSSLYTLVCLPLACSATYQHPLMCHSRGVGHFSPSAEWPILRECPVTMLAESSVKWTNGTPPPNTKNVEEMIQNICFTALFPMSLLSVLLLAHGLNGIFPQAL